MRRWRGSGCRRVTRRPLWRFRPTWTLLAKFLSLWPWRPSAASAASCTLPPTRLCQPRPHRPDQHTAVCLWVGMRGAVATRMQHQAVTKCAGVGPRDQAACVWPGRVYSAHVPADASAARRLLFAPGVPHVQLSLSLVRPQLEGVCSACVPAPVDGHRLGTSVCVEQKLMVGGCGCGCMGGGGTHHSMRVVPSTFSLRRGRSRCAWCCTGPR
jgi:hypothetical protein